MAIHEGWCIEAKCDRCGFTMFYPYSASLSSAELLTRKGWMVEKGRDRCPMCKAIWENAQRCEATANQRRRKKGRWGR